MLSARLSVQASFLCFAVVFLVGSLRDVPPLVATGRAVVASVLGLLGGRFIGASIERTLAGAESARIDRDRDREREGLEAGDRR